MKGIIEVANQQHGRYAARTEDDDYIAFELTDSIELCVGDAIAGVLDGHGSETFTRLESGEQFSVYVEMIGASRITASTWATA